MLTINLCYACNNREPNPIKVLELKYSKVIDILSEVYLANSQYNWDKAVFVINVKEDGGKYELKIAVLYKQDFGWLLRDKKEKLYGCFEFNKRPVLVFGEFANNFFSETDELRKFDWLKVLPRKKVTGKEIEEPPIIFEPEVWKYKFEQGTFLFVQKGTYSILD